MTELILMRHGQTAATKKRIYCGTRDLPLTDDTRGEVKESATRLPAFAHVYSSDLKRARQTANIVAPDAKVQISKALREIDFGAFDGFAASEIAERMPKQWREYIGDSVAFKFPGGDNVREFAARAAAEAKAIAALHQGDSVLVVTHKGFILSVLSMLLHGDAESMFKYDVRPAGYAHILIDGDAVVLKRLC